MTKELANWIENMKLNPEIARYFDESIKCYKVGAYKSAYLMAYIGMQSILRDRITNSDFKPTNIPANKWNEINSKLADENEWDAMVSDCVVRKNPDKIFLLTEDNIKQYEALRSIRNICAHGKRGKVGVIQVEFLWDFIMSYIHLFSVNGGIDSVKQMIYQHYDRTITPPGTDVEYIVKNILIAFHGSDLDDFIGWLYIESQKRDNIAVPCFDERNKYIELWDALYACSEIIRNAIIDYVKKSCFEELVYFVDRYDSSLDEIMYDKSIVRKLWTSEIVCNGFTKEGAWRILDRIVMGNMVPDDEKDLFYARLYRSISRYFPEEKVELLKKTDYFSRYRKDYIDVKNYTYISGGISKANYNAPLFFRYVKIFGLDLESVKSINEIFSFAKYGEFFDNTVGLMKKEDYLEQYKKICKDNELEDLSNRFIKEEGTVTVVN